MPSKADSPAPRRKGRKRERTREALIAAATELVREKGFERTTLEDIAKRAGMTSGAIYGNFKNRDELFMAVQFVDGGPIIPTFKEGGTPAEQVRILADAIIAAIPQRRAAAIGGLSFKAYMLSHEEMRLRMLEAVSSVYRLGGPWLQGAMPDHKFPMPMEILFPALTALVEGLFMQRFVAPELYPDEVFHNAIAALLGVKSDPES